MGEVCNFINRGDWAELDVNQQITLVGKESLIGFTYEGYRFERNYQLKLRNIVKYGFEGITAS